MLHGHPGNHHCLSVFAECLQDHLWIIAPDLRGYGQSPATAPFAMYDHLQDLEALLAHLQIDQYLALGWSLGGILALELALRSPAQVLGLILVATAARPVGNHPPVTIWDEINTGIASILNAIWPGWEWNIQTFGQRSLYRYLIRNHTPLAYRYLAAEALPAYLQTSPYARDALRSALRQKYNRLDQLDSLAARDLPVLVMAGAEDRHITSAASQETADRFPQAKLMVYPETAHLFPWEIPTQVQQDVKAWLQDQGWYPADHT